MDTLKHIIQETLDNFVSEAKKADRHEYWAERWKKQKEARKQGYEPAKDRRKYFRDYNMKHRSIESKPSAFFNGYRPSSNHIDTDKTPVSTDGYEQRYGERKARYIPKEYILGYDAYGYPVVSDGFGMSYDRDKSDDFYESEF